ncbi:MAG: CheB methylesterase [Polaromonas sp.]|nr:CheB methylesterase [Polaromonas sp.]
METLRTIGTPSAFTCPDCGGVLFELNGKRLVRYRCHTGHAFSLRSLAYTQEEATDASLWASLRSLQEKVAILRRLAQARAPNDRQAAQNALQEADALASRLHAAARAHRESPEPEKP